ncbi:MAG: hypothetical protein ACLTCF_01095 [Eggerthellaceae bacterium]
MQQQKQQMTQERLLGMLQAQQEKPLVMLRMLLERQRMMRGRLLKALPVKLAKLPKVPLALLLARPKKREEWQRALLVW